MSQENVDLVRRSLEAFIAGEILWDTLADDVEIHDHDIPDAGEYQGHAGVARWIADWREGLPVIALEIQALLDAGDVVVAVLLLKARPRGSSVDVERQDGIVYKCRDAKIAKLDYYNSKQQALGAAALEE